MLLMIDLGAEEDILIRNESFRGAKGLFQHQYPERGCLVFEFLSKIRKAYISCRKASFAENTTDRYSIDTLQFPLTQFREEILLLNVE